MHLSLRSFTGILPWLVARAAVTTSPPLNLTALTHSSNSSVLQCWSLTPPFQPTSNLVGASIVNLGAIAGNASFIVQPPRSTGGLHNAPRPQWSLVVSGLARIQIFSNEGNGNRNESAGEVWITGGKYGLIFANDVDTVNGHLTTFPGNDETILLTFETGGERVPEHGVLHEGPCEWEDLV